MAGESIATTETQQQPHKAYHPVYTVSNINSKIRTLDGEKVVYSKWVWLWEGHAEGHRVLSHIDGTAPPEKTDPTYASWKEIDAIVLSWIYSTISDDLLSRVITAKSTAYEAWTRVKKIFVNNKGARAAALEHEFNNLKLASQPSLEAYCQRLREIADLLAEVDAPVTDQRLVLQLVRGLPAEYDTVAAMIHQTLPTFEDAQTQLFLEKHRTADRDDHSPSTALVAPTAPPPPPAWDDNPRDPPSQQQAARTNNNNSGRNRRHNQPNRGRGRNFSGPPRGGSHHQSWSHQPTWQPSWSIPPCPFPTNPGWSPVWSAPVPTPSPAWSQPPQYTGSRGGRNNNRGFAPSPSQFNYSAPSNYSGPYNGQAHMVDFDPQPTDIGQAFQALSMDPYGDANWYMDTGATSHLTSDAGPSDWEYDYAE